MIDKALQLFKENKLLVLELFILLLVGLIIFGGYALFRDERQVEGADLALFNAQLANCEYDAEADIHAISTIKCVAEVGQYVLQMKNFNVTEAVEICSTIEGNNDSTDIFYACVQGVFISLYNHPSLEVTLDTLNDICAQYSPFVSQICHSEAFSLLGEDILKYERVEELCIYSEDRGDRRNCFDTLHMIAAEKYLELEDSNNMKLFTIFCMSATEDNRHRCLDSGILKLLELDISLVREALEICDEGQRLDSTYDCSRMMAGYFPDVQLRGDAQARSIYCALLPPELSDLCVKGIDIDHSFYE